MDRKLVHDSGLDVILDPLSAAQPENIFLEEPGAIVIRDRVNEVEIRVNLGQCVGLINALTEMWITSYYG